MFSSILEVTSMCAGRSSHQRTKLNRILIQLLSEMFKGEFFSNMGCETYLFRLVHLELLPRSVHSRWVLSLGRLLRRGFEFDLSLGRGCSTFPRGRPDKAAPLFLHNNSLRLQALPSVRAISDCKPVAMEMEVGEERRDEVHGDRLLPVAALGPKSPLRALRAQLAELGRPTYGSKYQCWKRLQRAQEGRAEADAAMAAGPADVQVPGRPVEPLSEERERDTLCHTYHRSRGASIACVDELLKEITSGSRLSKRTESFRSLRLILPS